MARYTFVTRWRFDAPLAAVWDEIFHPERWPDWWKAIVSVRNVKSGGADGVGAIRRYTWRGSLPYQLTFDMRTTRVVEHVRLEGEATGELTGRGCWHFSTEGAATLVQYDWEVDATKWWMRLLSPIARPLFEWNHDTVMRWGFEGLTRRLKNDGESAN
jgi:hypothetical protein